MNRSKAGLAIQVPRKGFDAGLALSSFRKIAAEHGCRVLGDGPENGRVPTWVFPRKRSMLVFLISTDAQYRDTDPTTLPVNAMTNERLNAA